jgi:thiol:disulfide interchange protein DsbD
MIPFTINFFAKQQEAGRNLPLLGGLYALGIIVFFVVLGLVVAGIFGRSITDLSGHAITNLVIGLIFVTLGLSLFGVIHINLPSGLTNAVGGGRSGYIGALLMGLTFAVTAFTCTAPIAGLVLAEAATGSRSLLGAAFYLSVYGAVIGVPFFFLAMSPKLLAALPRSGGWMNEFKVVGGVVEIAAAFKFLIISDLAWGWGIFRRDPVLAAWAMLCFFAAAYLLGWFRTASDSPVQRWHHPTRLAFVLAFLALAIWFVAGLAGRNLGAWEGLFPG